MKTQRTGRLRKLALAVLCFTFVEGTSAGENVWKTHGPTNVGWINDLTISDSIAYAATLSGIFRSEDRAASWQQSGLAGESIAQIFTAPGAAVVLATSGGALYASRDAGRTWAPVPGLPPVRIVALDPRQPSVAYAGTEDAAIWKSTDAGSSWQRLPSSPGSDAPLVFAFDASAIYAQAFEDFDSSYQLFKSLDGGVSWAKVSSPIPYPSTIATGAASGFVYTGGQGRFCRSADSATTWTCSGFPQVPLGIVEVPGESSSEAPRLLAVSQDHLYVSRDAGATWVGADVDLGSAGYFPALASDSSGSLVLVGTVTQVLRSNDRGDSWTSADAGLHSSSISALAVGPDDPARVWAAAFGFAGSRESGLFRSADAGRSWSLGNGPAGSPTISALLMVPGHPSTLYAGAAQGSEVYRSDDDGAHWTSSSLIDGGVVRALAVDPASSERVWAVASGGLFRSDDGARTWSNPPGVAQEVYSILFDGKRPGTMYAGSYFALDTSGFYPEPYGGGLFVSRDSGASWTRMSRDFGTAVLSIATDPFHDGGLFVGTDRAVFRSADDGVTWQGPSIDLPESTVRVLVADPVRPGRLYAAVDTGGVYRTIDSGQHWSPFSSGLGSLQVSSLVISADGRWLHAGTYGGGVFELELVERRILPVVGSTPGVNGTFFRTSVQLHNPGDTSIAGRIVFHPSGIAGTDDDPELSYSLAPGQTQSITDLLPAMGTSGLGSADIEITSGEVPVATARVFNDAGASGTTGFTESAMRSDEALGAGQTGVLLLPADLTVARFNVGIRTLEDGASVTFALRNAAGASIASITRTLPPNYHEQADTARFFGSSSLPPGGSISITVSSGAAIVYGATVDNGTGDPSLQIARVSP